MTAVAPVEGRAATAPLCPPPEAAFADFYKRHSNHVFAYCLKHLRSREEAEDAAQTTFLYAWRGLGRGVVPVFEPAWLLTIARNVCLNRAEAAGRRAVEVAQDPSVLEDTVPAPIRGDELEGLPEALAHLTEQQRRAILLREWKGLSYKEIARELGLSQSAVETLLFRARRTLAARLRRPLGVGSLLPWCKSLLAGGGAKLTIGAAAVVVTAAAGTVATVGHKPAAVPAKTPAAFSASPVAHNAMRARAVRAAKHSGAPSAVTRHDSKRPVASVDKAPTSGPAANAPAANGPAASEPAAAGPPESVKTAPPVARTSEPPPSASQVVTSTVATSTVVAAAAAEPVRSVVDTATSTAAAAVSSTAGAAGDTAAAALKTVSSAVDAVQSAVATVTPPQAPALPPLPALPPVTVTVTVTLPKLPLP
jgi:RNA polymerase sigma-70 factor (ECF subfamily)